ncbi:MAG: hypothetical protein ABIF40_05385 [archaeon]
MEKVYLRNYVKDIKRLLERIKNLSDVDEDAKLAVELFTNHLYAQNFTFARISYYLTKLV